MERAINSLKLNGFLVNSHTQNAYLDEERFWPILEAAEALGARIRQVRIPDCLGEGQIRSGRYQGHS
jgi:predicted TIM-barrel fold metal-dependent hydrolase